METLNICTSQHLLTDEETTWSVKFKSYIFNHIIIDEQDTVFEANMRHSLLNKNEKMPYPPYENDCRTIFRNLSFGLKQHFSANITAATKNAFSVSRIYKDEHANVGEMDTKRHHYFYPRM